MKTIESIGKLFLLLLIIGNMTSCTDEDEIYTIGSQSGKLIKQVVINNKDYFQFHYDGKKLIKTEYIYSDGRTDTYSYNYQDDELKIISYNYIDGVMSYTLNEKGHINSHRDASEIKDIPYNSDNYLSYWTYIYRQDILEGGFMLYRNSLQMHYRSGNRLETVSEKRNVQYKYTYNKYQNKSKINILEDNILGNIELYVGGLIGQAPKNLVSRIEIVTSDNTKTINYTYELDDEGYITKIRETKGSERTTYTFSYY